MLSMEVVGVGEARIVHQFQKGEIFLNPNLSFWNFDLRTIRELSSMQALSITSRNAPCVSPLLVYSYHIFGAIFDVWFYES